MKKKQTGPKLHKPDQIFGRRTRPDKRAKAWAGADNGRGYGRARTTGAGMGGRDGCKAWADATVTRGGYGAEVLRSERHEPVKSAKSLLHTGRVRTF